MPTAVAFSCFVAELGHLLLLVQDVVDARPVELDVFVARKDMVGPGAHVAGQDPHLEGDPVRSCQVVVEHAG